MIDLPSWAAIALDVFYYSVFGPLLILYAVFGVVFMIAAIAVPIWAAIFGRVPGERGEPPAPITRLVIGLAGLALLCSLVLPWL